jgi:peptide/nickel transport system ATP-binding protein
VRNLKTEFSTESGVLHAVDDVSFDIRAGETLGLVGESGSGKSVTALSIMRLVQAPGRVVSGQVQYKGRNLLALSPAKMMRLRGRDIAMIFQEPMTSLNPELTIGDQIAESVQLH